MTPQMGGVCLARTKVLTEAGFYDHDPMADKSEMGTIRRVVWGRRFLGATVVVPSSVAEHLNTDAMAVLAVIRAGDALCRWHGSLSAPTSAGPKFGPSLGSPRASV